MRALMWFRNDLRIHDNFALFEACRRAGRDASGGVVGVYVISPKQWHDHDTGAPKVDLVRRTLHELKSDLEGINVPLLIGVEDWFEDVPDLLVRIADECGCDEIYFNREYEVNESRRDVSVERAFRDAGKKASSHHDMVVMRPGTVLTKDDSFYTVYSPFKKRWRQMYLDGEAAESVGTARKQPEIEVTCGSAGRDVPSVERFREWGFDVREGAERGVRPDLWPAGEQHALKRLRGWVKKGMSRYKDERDFPGSPATSTLSPYLAIGCVSPRQCIDMAAAENGGWIDRALTENGPSKSKSNGATKWIDEVIWREFYKHLLVGYPKLSMGKPFRADIDSVDWRYAEDEFGRWCRGETGYPIVDAGMRQLNTTGWMHNRLRMITAMFLTKDLMIDWRWGERYFSQRLVDCDLSQNNGGWQWSASTGTDAQPYFRIMNPWLQSKRYDPDGAYIKRFVPELSELEGDDVHEPHLMDEDLYSRIAYPAPMVDHHECRDRTLRLFEAVKKG